MKLAAGQLAEEVILVSQRVRPSRLTDSGYQFAFPTLEQTLRHELGRYDRGNVTSRIDRAGVDRRVA
jgi:NAD dependent epimerase/dehydratase family enzyme